MARIHIVDLPRLSRVVVRVQGELERHGLWNDRLQSIEVYLVPVGFSYGWQWYEGDGTIEIPSVSLLRLRDFLAGSYLSLSDVIRHEYAHAVADLYRGLIRSRHFRKAFGGAHEDPRPSEFNSEEHVTRYAATNPSEDFAEVFMLYLRHGGILPTRYGTPGIRRRWGFVRNLCVAIRKGKARW